jgi:DNA mismatch repair protein MutS
MESLYQGITNYHVTAKEEKNGLQFYHKLEKGGINKSYGIQVAKMAGVLDSVIDRAINIQKDLEEDVFLKTKSSNKNTKNIIYKKEQKTLF